MRRVDKPDFRSASGTGDTLNPPTQSVTWVETRFCLSRKNRGGWRQR